MADKGSLFPFPRRTETATYDGSIVAAPAACKNCASPACVASRSSGLELCAYGYNHQRLEPGVTMVGVVAREYAGSSQARSKRLREVGASAVPRNQVERAVATYNNAVDELERAVEEEKSRLLREYQESAQYSTEFLAKVKDDIRRGLALFHDYKQINAAITHHINVVLETRYKNIRDFQEKLALALPSERAIYEAAKFLDEKLSVAQFLMTPEWLEKKGECHSFRFSGLVTKYRQIYKGVAEQKNIRFKPIGDSRLEIVANAHAVAVIPHTLIDNAVKRS